MAIDVSQLVDYSWSDIAKAAKTSMLNSALGGSTLSINGRAIGRISIKEAKELYETATTMMNDESTDAGGGTALVQYGERL